MTLTTSNHLYSASIGASLTQTRALRAFVVATPEPSIGGNPPTWLCARRCCHIDGADKMSFSENAITAMHISPESDASQTSTRHVAENSFGRSG